MSPPAAETVLHPLLDQLFTRHGFTRVAADTLDAFAAAPGHALLIFTEDPQRYKETLDLAVIAPEVAKAFAGRFRSACWCRPTRAGRRRVTDSRAGRPWSC